MTDVRLLRMTDSGKVPLIKCKTRSLPFELWPADDRSAWIAACQPPKRLKPGGIVGHLKPATRNQYAERYATYLGFLNRCGLLALEGEPGTNVTPDKVGA